MDVRNTVQIENQKSLTTSYVYGSPRKLNASYQAILDIKYAKGAGSTGTTCDVVIQTCNPVNDTGANPSDSDPLWKTLTVETLDGSGITTHQAGVHRLSDAQFVSIALPLAYKYIRIGYLEAGTIVTAGKIDAYLTVCEDHN